MESTDIDLGLQREEVWVKDRKQQRRQRGVGNKAGHKPKEYGVLKDK